MSRIIIVILIGMSIIYIAGCTKKPVDLSDTTLTFYMLDQIQVNGLWNEDTDYVNVNSYDNLQETISYQSPHVNLQKYDRVFFNNKMIIIHWFENNQGITDISINDVLLEDEHLIITINVIHNLTMAAQQCYLFIEINKLSFNSISIDVIEI